MSAYERLLRDAAPSCPELPHRPRHAPDPWTPEERAQHVADLEAALNGWEYDRPRRQARHLTVVTDAEAA